ncbi:hypothetical protein ACFYTS_36105 [Nocardia sp. NPDC004151]|uniref:hypothetical protein n=1 Tax=Nocardia sp. NPDC004151 TaxID=3364304 RepID=UPI00369F202E
MEIDNAIGELAVQLLDATAVGARLLFQVKETPEGDILQIGFSSDVRDDLDWSEDLYEAIVQLIGMHKESGTGLIGGVYEFEKNPDGSWSMRQEYEYGEPEPHFFAARAEAAEASRRTRQGGWRRWFGRG